MLDTIGGGWFSILTLILGIVLGLVSGMVTAYVRQRQAIGLKIVDQYFEVRKEVCAGISKLASIPIGTRLDHAELQRTRVELVEAFYLHYDFLPTEVLRELICLHACLASPRSTIFCCRGRRLRPLAPEDVDAFLENIALVEELKAIGPINLASPLESVRRSARVSYQARTALQALNEHFTLRNLLRWDRFFVKAKRRAGERVLAPLPTDLRRP